MTDETPRAFNPIGELAANMARKKKQLDDELQAIEAENAKLSQGARLAAEARARMEADSILREKATLEAIHAVREVAIAAAEESVGREQAAADREARLLGMTEKLLTITTWLAVIAFFTLMATIFAVILAA